MKKILKIIGVSLLLIVGLIVVLLVWYDQSRSFYCLSNGKCVTVWKRLGGKCYIIPGKYYGVLNPSDVYIETTNWQYLTLYFSIDLPDKIIIRNQGSETGEMGGYKIINNKQINLKIVEYSDYYKGILYKPDAIKFKDVKAGTEYIDIDVYASYATDKTGKNIK